MLKIFTIVNCYLGKKDLFFLICNNQIKGTNNFDHVDSNILDDVLRRVKRTITATPVLGGRSPFSLVK